jgi:hypothetical protein
MSRDEFDADYRPRHQAADTRRRGLGRRQRAFLLVAGVLLALALVGVGVGRAVMVRVWEEQSRARSEQAHRRPAGWVPGIDRGSHSRSAIPRAEFEKLVLGRSPAEVWSRFPNGPMPADIDAAETLEFIGETADPTSGAPDAATTVEFEGGRAVQVRYL